LSHDCSIPCVVWAHDVTSYLLRWSGRRNQFEGEVA